MSIDVKRLYEDIKRSPDMIPDKYDGSYELMDSIVREYSKLPSLSDVTFLDLNAVYGMAIGTWKLSIEKKKDYVNKTCLPPDSKMRLYEVMDHVWDRACRNDYLHNTEKFIEESIEPDFVYNYPIVGMFGTGFYSFNNTPADQVERFIQMCISIQHMEDDESMYKTVEKTMTESIVGMQTASLSVILHCLKPYSFPILNGIYKGMTIYPILGVELDNMKNTRTYAENCRRIKQYRDSNFGRISYRVFDAFSMHLDEYEIREIQADNEPMKTAVINIDNLKTAIKLYKQNFTIVVEEENYKWIAVKQFKDNFDIDAPDFAEMYMTATSKTFNLLTRSYFYARATMKELAEDEPETVREMFRNLYDETLPVSERIQTFKDSAKGIFKRKNKQKKTFQDYKAISTYLFLMYPDTYSLYLPTKFEDAAEYLDYKIINKAGSVERIEEYFTFVDKIWEYAKQDSELIALNRSRLTDHCDEDINNHILAEDLVYFIYRNFTKKPDDEDYWWPSEEEYPVDISKDEWKTYIREVEMPSHPFIMKMLKGMMELGGTASCKQLSETYGGNPSSYVGRTVNLGRRAKEYFDLPECMDGDKERFFPIPFQGHRGAEQGVNQYMYRIRPELKTALDEMDLSGIDPVIDTDPVSNRETRYWLYAPGRNASEWNTCRKDQVMLLGWSELGDLNQYETRDAITNALKEIHGDKGSYIMDSLATWEFSRDIKEGDIIFAKKGRSRILGKGTVTSEYYYDETRGEFPNVIDVEWTHVGEWKSDDLLQIKTLTEIYADTEKGQRLINLIPANPIVIEKYTDTDFLNDVYVSAQKLQEMKDLLGVKKNIILQGAPGVGKTFSAEKLAYTMMGEKDNSRIQFIQFHQNYSYEDFIMGFKPTDDGGFKLESGVFYNFCEMAREDENHDYFFIIDEINRGNMSKIFGELLMAIEADYREHDVRLAYKDEDFSVPKNVYLIGMMNTADRSLAMIDYALRRRFSFISMEPGFNTEGFKAYQESLDSLMFNKLIDAVKGLNGRIRSDESLGKGFCIGHSYFCGMEPQECTANRLQQIVKYDLIPTLEEYWFDNEPKLKSEVTALKEAVNLTDK